ncbi:MAG: arylesterase [Deltaproteobacteria bacterium]|nr:arylesterase [Deltaproteobacteria bacterium]
MVVGRKAFVVLALAGIVFVAIHFEIFSSSPKVRPLAINDSIVAFGDSITAGEGVASNESYPYLLQTMLKRTVINAGVTGELSFEGLQRLPRVISENEPSLVILCHGGNDILQKTGKEEAAKNIEEMVKILKARDIDVVIIGVPERGLILSSANFYKEVADKYGLPYDGDVLPDIVSDSSLKSDAVHPNAKGNRLLAKSLEKLLRRAGAIKRLNDLSRVAGRAPRASLHVSTNTPIITTGEL